MANSFLLFRRIAREQDIPSLIDTIRHGVVPPQYFVRVLAPVCKELHNGSLFRMLRSFLRQTASPHNFRIFFLVNNSPQIAADNEHPLFIENQLTLAVLRYAAGETDEMPECLHTASDWKRETIERVRQRGLQITVYDYASSGIPRNIGKIRNLQFLLSLARLGSEDISALFDADTVTDRDFVESIVVKFYLHEADALFLNKEYRPSEGFVNDSLLRTGYSAQVFTSSESVRRLIFEGIDWQCATPQIVVKTRILEKLGGIPELNGEEDLELALGLRQQAYCVHADNIRVVPADRARPEGYDSAARLIELKKSKTGRASVDKRVLLGDWLLHLLKCRLNSDQVPETYVGELFEFLGIHFDRRLWRDCLKEVYLPGQGVNLIQVSERYFAILDEMDKLSVTIESQEDQLLGWLASHCTEPEYKVLVERLQQAAATHNHQAEKILEFLKIAFHNLEAGLPIDHGIDDADVQEFLECNPWAPSFLESARAEYGNEAEWLASLQDRFSDWLSPWEAVRAKKAVVTYQTVARFVQEARNYPERFPKLYAFLQRGSETFQRFVG